MSDPFAKVPHGVTSYFDGKGLEPSGHWLEFNFDAHALSFTVARTAGYDVLGLIRDAMSKAISTRQGFDEFAAGLEPLLKARGWWGKTEDGVQLGSPSRLRKIYDVNLQSARAAGDWEEIQFTKEVLPYLEYLISVSAHKREEHLGWVGTILPVDDPWWDTHYPPNGWNCKCRVRQISGREAGLRGYDPKAKAPDLGSAPFTNKVTGEVIRVPNGIDPGFASNPGKRRMQNASDLLAGRLEAAPEAARRIATADLANSWLAQRIIHGDVPFVPGDAGPANLARGDLAVPLAVLPSSISAGAASVVRLSVRDALAMGAKAMEAGSFVRVQQLLDAGQLVESGEGEIVATGQAGQVWWRASLIRIGKALEEVYLTGLAQTENAPPPALGNVLRPAISELPE